MFSVAPMMDLTDRHCRYFHRKLSSKSLLYTEMITAKAVLYGDTNSLLKYNPAEKPLALQVGGSDPQELAEVTVIAEELGFDEINLNNNCQCSNERVLNTFKSMDQKEITYLFNEKKSIEVVCEFCKTKRVYSEQDLKQLFFPK